jgi:isocitrate lyase
MTTTFDPPRLQQALSGSASEAANLEQAWREEDRWVGVQRDYTAAEVIGLRGTLPIDCGYARAASERLWELLRGRDFVHALGAL